MITGPPASEPTGSCRQDRRAQVCEHRGNIVDDLVLCESAPRRKRTDPKSRLAILIFFLTNLAKFQFLPSILSKFKCIFNDFGYFGRKCTDFRKLVGIHEIMRRFCEDIGGKNDLSASAAKFCKNPQILSNVVRNTAEIRQISTVERLEG